MAETGRSDPSVNDWERTSMGAAWAAAIATAATISVAASAAEARISGPYQSANLSVFLVHAEPGAGRAEDGRYLTLAEALASGEAVVFETGDVNELEVQNTSKDRTLFIQAGDIVKGGRQDRVLSVDLILPPGAGKTPITAFCVEHGRWSARGTESAQAFASADKSLAGKELRLAAKSARSQQGVWDAVAKTQEKLAAALGVAVVEPSSPTSLQLTLENERVAKAVTESIAALSRLTEEHPDAIGYLYAVNGAISGGDIYASAALFKKQWPRLLEASATEAVAERLTEASGRTATADDAAAFLTEADSLKSTEEDLPAGVTLVSRDGDKAAAFETRSNASKGWIHRSYIVK
jgi:hypothetical protein